MIKLSVIPIKFLLMFFDNESDNTTDADCDFSDCDSSGLYSFNLDSDSFKLDWIEPLYDSSYVSHVILSRNINHYKYI